MQISYFEPIAGVSGKEIVVTEDMVNTSGINSANLGMQDALVVYTGSASEGSNATYTYTIGVLVKADLTGHNIEGSYTLIEPLQEMYSFQGIDAYDNGIAQKYALDSEGKKQLLGQCCYEIVRESSSAGSAVIKVTDGECKLFFSIAPENQIVPLVFSGETKTYTSSSEAFGTATTAKSGTFAVGEKTYKVVSWWHGTDTTTDIPFATFELAEDNTFAFASDGRVFMRGRLVEEGNVLVIEEVQ